MHGLLALIGVNETTSNATPSGLSGRLLGCQVFRDKDDRMNRSPSDVGGGLLLVPQFTLAADASKGTRPGFFRLPPANRRSTPVRLPRTSRAGRASSRCDGRFGAEMRVSLVNHGPVTFWLNA